MKMSGAKRQAGSVWTGANYFILALLSLAALYPLWYVVASSFSSSRAITAGEVFLWPVEFNVLSYRRLMEDGQLFVAMKNTVILTAVGTLFNIVMTVLAAYPLSRRRLMGRNSILMLITFSMLFISGIIPNFILVKFLGLMDSYWGLWLPALISTYNLFVMKTFMEGLPEEIEESAAIDGAGDWLILVRIMLPLCKPIIAALSLFYAVGWWNSYFSVLIYISDTTKQTLSVKLYQMILQVDQSLLTNVSGSEGASQIVLTPEGLKAAAIVIAITPILLVYPFLQKHFVKGVLIGSVKG
ncbi:carbohydrate ABC transporter permease [Paenibacillus beijingensis]|uniref:ABC transporter permease n=1 Tax=Paenibacillus beijingensis TaxID=1126833 RepID=A0A0D5NFX6_9BACL|nr:carbohydrate ABC transporter permease [Paenibacillus beijingensis]AJY74279.1 ABC transporter permease [Paenibacillus beijingensis]